MFRITLKTWIFFLFIVISMEGFSQLTTVSFTPSKDSYIDMKYATTNYGTDSIMQVTTHAGAIPHTWTYSRSYIEFDLDTIPSEVEIYSAKLRLYKDSAYAGTNTFKLKRVVSSWTETGITGNSQPSISAFATDASSTYDDSTDYIEFDLKDITQRLSSESVTNYGWSIQQNNETLSEESGADFYTHEKADSTLWPVLVVEYGTRLSLSNVNVIHESDSAATDGSIEIVVAGGTAPYTYEWYDGDSDAIISGATEDSLGGRAYGWYGVHVTDTFGFELYQAFVIGEDCAEISFTYDPKEDYMPNAMTNSRYDNATYNYGDKNYEDYNGFVAKSRYGLDQESSLIDFPLWMDPGFTISQADLHLNGWGHVTASHHASPAYNDSKLFVVSEDWKEDLVTANFSPGIDTNVYIDLAGKPNGGEDDTLDLTAFWNVWKTDNNANYGCFLDINDKISPKLLSQVYFSPIWIYADRRPHIEFTLNLNYSTAPVHCNPVYVNLERKLSGAKHIAQVDHIYFAYDNEYASASANLDYQIFANGNRLTPVMDGTTDALALNFGSNEFKLDVSSLTTGDIYLLQVTNDKGEKRYLRFEKD